MSDITITDATFEQLVLKSTKPVLVDFWAVWCGPCQMQGPIVEDVARQIGDKAVVGKVNVDENHSLAAKFHIHSIPNFILLLRVKVTILPTDFVIVPNYCHDKLK
ncbi:MAG: Thioredoxin [Candidatus Roizmanbacteria bacterium GW2011_GWC1_37_12]|nr:MAG: Thioredoxin [Candidatus Roizmanbacteria bacterium GW2011_GWC1_37_12]